jgi:hypothetical protein
MRARCEPHPGRGCAYRPPIHCSVTRAWIALLTIAIWTMTTSGARCEGKTYWVMGEGMKSCGEYLRAVEGERKARPATASTNEIYTMNYEAFEYFADGFLTGANLEGPETRTGQGTDAPGRMAWLENYCRRNPLDTYLTALAWLRRHLIEHEQ